MQVSRTLTFGEHGVSQSQFFSQFLSTVKLNEEEVDWAGEELSYLQPKVWAAEFAEAVEGASVVKTLEEFAEEKCSKGESVKYAYGDINTYPSVAHRFGYIEIGVKPGIVFISLQRKPRPFSSKKKSTRAIPSQ